MFNDVLLCFTMFSESRNDRDRHCHISDRMATDHLRDRDNTAGFGDNGARISNNSTEIDDEAARIVDISA